MGTGKKEAARKVRQGKVGDGMANVKTKVRPLRFFPWTFSIWKLSASLRISIEQWLTHLQGENFYRSAKYGPTLHPYRNTEKELVPKHHRDGIRY